MNVNEINLSRFGNLTKNLNLSHLSRFGVGGSADFFLNPYSEESLCSLVKNYDKTISVIGNCSNVFISDKGIRNLVLKLGNEFCDIHSNNEIIYVGAGVLLSELSYKALKSSISGLEFFATIPGSVGGALAMNAGAYGGDVSSTLLYAKAVDENGTLHKLTPKDIGYIYRGNSLSGRWIFTGAAFKGTCSEESLIRKTMRDIIEKRAKTQPFGSKTCGSTFKNPEKYPAWKVIAESGCRGLSVGDAVVSDLHCNFIINNGNASSLDVLKLCNIITQKVFDKFNINLELEVKKIGEY